MISKINSFLSEFFDLRKQYGHYKPYHVTPVNILIHVPAEVCQALSFIICLTHISHSAQSPDSDPNSDMDLTTKVPFLFHCKALTPENPALSLCVGLCMFYCLFDLKYGALSGVFVFLPMLLLASWIKYDSRLAVLEQEVPNPHSWIFTDDFGLTANNVGVLLFPVGVLGQVAGHFTQSGGDFKYVAPIVFRHPGLAGKVAYFILHEFILSLLFVTIDTTKLLGFNTRFGQAKSLCGCRSRIITNIREIKEKTSAEKRPLTVNDFDTAADAVRQKWNIWNYKGQFEFTQCETLDLYANFKQGTIGDVRTARPGMFDVKGRTKWDAWKKLQGMSQTEAKSKYVEHCNALFAKYKWTTIIYTRIQ